MKLTAPILTFFLIIALDLFCQDFSKDSLNKLIDSSNNLEETLKWRVELLEIEQDSVFFNQQVKTIEESLPPKREKVQGDIFYDLAFVFYKNRKYQQGIRYINDAITYYEQIKDNQGLAKAFLLKSRFEDRMSQYNFAILSIQKSLSYFRKTNNYLKQVDCLNKMGIIHKKIGNSTEALRLYHQAFEICEKENIDKRKPSTCINIGIVLKNDKKYQEALDYYFKAEKFFNNSKANYSGLANVYNNIGNVYRLQGLYHQALNYYHLAIENRMAAGQEERLGYTYNNIAIVYMELKKYDKALTYLFKSEQLKIKNNEEEYLSSTYLNISELFLNQKKYKEFNQYWRKSRSFALKYQQDDIRRNLLVLRSQYEAEIGNHKAAYIYLSSVYKELDTIDVQSQKILNSVLQAQFNDKQNKNEIHELSDAILLLDQQKEEIERKKDTFKYLLIGLGVLSIFFITLAVLFFFKQKDLKQKTVELAITNQQLKETTVSVEEKELLLKEIHHRVKNNLQIIQSLIRLQNSEEKECLKSDMLTDFELRVSSMALVHETLYQEGNLTSINVREYFENLIENLMGVYQLENNIQVENKILIDELDIDTLVPLGLLSTEIISNSMKYGVSSLKSGKITVFLSPLKEDRYKLQISDNGKGFDMEEKKHKNTLGIELIYTLTEQLDGELDFSNESGASYTIKFKAQAKNK